MFILFKDWWGGIDLSLSLPPRFLICHRLVSFSRSRGSIIRGCSTRGTRNCFYLSSTRDDPLFERLPLLLISLPPLIICGRRVISWSRGRNNNAGNVSPEESLRNPRERVAWLWRRARSLDGAWAGPTFVPRSFQVMGKFVVEEWRGRGRGMRTIGCRRALMFRYKSSLDYTLDYTFIGTTRLSARFRRIDGLFHAGEDSSRLVVIIKNFHACEKHNALSFSFSIILMAVKRTKLFESENSWLCENDTGWRMVSFFVCLPFFLFVCHVFIVTWNLLKILIRVERIPKWNPKFILAEGTMMSWMVPVHLIDLLNKVNYWRSGCWRQT